MTEVISVRFKSKGKVYFFDPAGNKVEPGEFVIVETSKGLEYAECVRGNHQVEDTSVVQPLRPVMRKATEEDSKRAEENRKKEAEAFDICREKILKHGLDMKLVDVEYNFEGNKILFFFTSDGRVDFRELVKDLASVFKTRIELRQIGVRDEARMLGGLGICGKPFCCAQFLDSFQPVSIKMAKTQGLSLNPAKVSGTCGRLMCCLKYEQDAYEDLVKKVPKVDSFVETPLGKGSVTDVNLLRSTVRVRLEDQSDTSLHSFNADEIEVLGGKAKRAEYLAAKAEGLIVEEPKPAVKQQIVEKFDETEKLQAEKPKHEHHEKLHRENHKKQEHVKSTETKENPTSEIAESKQEPKPKNKQRHRSNRGRSGHNAQQKKTSESAPVQTNKSASEPAPVKHHTKPEEAKNSAEQGNPHQPNHGEAHRGKKPYYRRKSKKPVGGQPKTKSE